MGSCCSSEGGGAPAARGQQAAAQKKAAPAKATEPIHEPPQNPTVAGSPGKKASPKASPRTASPASSPGKEPLGTVTKRRANSDAMTSQPGGGGGAFASMRSASAPVDAHRGSATFQKRQSGWFSARVPLEEAIYYCGRAVYGSVMRNLDGCGCGTPPLVMDESYDVTLTIDVEEGVTVTMYMPEVFRWFRTQQGVCGKRWAEAWCGDFAIAGSAGKSGATFARAADGLFFLKSINDGEQKVMRGQTFRDLQAHVAKSPESLINRPYALYDVNVRGKHFHLLALANVFDPEVAMTTTWDLKGSTQGRTSKPEEHKKPCPLLKDNDWVNAGHRIPLPRARFDRLAQVIQNDASFFAQHDLMDYSLFVGKVGGGAPSAASHAGGAVVTAAGSAGGRYYIGIIDYLQVYNTGKKIAHSVKGLLSNVDTISTIPPADYAQRFEKFMREVVLDRVSASE